MKCVFCKNEAADYIPLDRLYAINGAVFYVCIHCQKKILNDAIIAHIAEGDPDVL